MDPAASHYSHPMPAGDHYSQQPSSQSQQQPSQWSHTPHLVPPAHNQSSFPSPSSPSASLADSHYPPFYQSQQQQNGGGGESGNMVDRSSTQLSLNLSSLSVTSPTNLSPIHPQGSHMSPLTPISPSNAPSMHHQNTLSPHHHHHHHHHPMQHPFQYTPPEQGGGGGMRYDDPQYDSYNRRLTSSRSSSSSEKSVPRKRSYTTTAIPNPVNEENAPTPVSYSTNMDTSYDEVDMSYGPGLDAEGSPVDGSTSGGEQDDQVKPMDHIPSASAPSAPGAVNVMGKPLGTNNFVTKLYQCVFLFGFLR
ncbi:hypothetical protein K474DRAFT_655611 [Panus rudis PR-1116 ss-1]|nr:hypothetical protein K474DRAFT_655611 [Panus rudis PR-1116 ss-1]